MNKVGKTLRILLLISTILLNVICYQKRTLGLTSWGHVFYYFLMILLIIITIQDIRKKRPIHQNNIYNWISIFTFLVMDYILVRTLLDTHLFFNNQVLIKEYNKYRMMLYPGIGEDDFREFAMYYFKQNMIYFNGMLLLLLSYRKRNQNIK